MNVVSGTRRMRFGKEKNVLCWCIKPSLSFGKTHVCGACVSVLCVRQLPLDGMMCGDSV